MKFVILIFLVLAVVTAWRFRVQILAKILGQPERRIERRLNQRRD